MMEKKTGVFVCSGCGIGDALDMESLKAIPVDRYSIPTCIEHSCLCSPEGIAQIRNRILTEGIN
ncbi:MAG: hypothetical protein GX422_12110, partial [Deltaproteobacteria bacterium]|nr:hypothetical protein [Deltaproteobacteria bacterium]